MKDIKQPKSIIEEQINEIKAALNLQNYRVKKKFAEKQKNANLKNLFSEFFIKFDAVRKYSQNVIVPKLNDLQENKRYKFNYLDNSDISDSSDISKYFKVIITNIVSKQEHFIIVSFDSAGFILKQKQLFANDNLNVDVTQIPLQRFTKSKFRKILFEYVLDIIKKETLSKRKLFDTNEPVFL